MFKGSQNWVLFDAGEGQVCIAIFKVQRRKLHCISIITFVRNFTWDRFNYKEERITLPGVALRLTIYRYVQLKKHVSPEFSTFNNYLALSVTWLAASASDLTLKIANVIAAICI